MKTYEKETVADLIRQIDEIRNETSLTFSQLRVLIGILTVEEDGDLAKPGRLARQVGVSAPAVTSACDNLVRRGFVARSQRGMSGLEDRREVVLTTTEKSRVLFR